MPKRRVAEFCRHCGRIWDLHLIPDEACPTGDNTFTPTMPDGFDTKHNLRALVQHCWLYSGYPQNGYDKMSLEMKALYHNCHELGE
jgi:hypothetical protein